VGAQQSNTLTRHATTLVVRLVVANRAFTQPGAWSRLAQTRRQRFRTLLQAPSSPVHTCTISFDGT
jgi:hypothetical protein